MAERLAPSLRLKSPKEKSFHQANILQRVLVEPLSHAYIPIITVEGIANIQTAHDLWCQNEKLAIFPNHLTNADAETIYQGFKRTGFNDLARMLVFSEGEKLRRNYFTKFLTGSQNRVFVWPESLEPENEEEAAQKSAMNVKATRHLIKAVNNGYVPVVFAEGGRSYEGRLKNADPKVARLLKLIGVTTILPIGISGIEKIFPPQKKLVLPNPFQPVTLAVGYPIDLNWVFDQYRDCPREEQYSKVIDHAMLYGVAPLLKPQYRGVYAQ